MFDNSNIWKLCDLFLLLSFYSYSYRSLIHLITFNCVLITALRNYFWEFPRAKKERSYTCLCHLPYSIIYFKTIYPRDSLDDSLMQIWTENPCESPHHGQAISKIDRFCFLLFLLCSAPRQLSPWCPIWRRETVFLLIYIYSKAVTHGGGFHFISLPLTIFWFISALSSSNLTTY